MYNLACSQRWDLPRCSTSNVNRGQACSTGTVTGLYWISLPPRFKLSCLVDRLHPFDHAIDQKYVSWSKNVFVDCRACCAKRASTWPPLPILSRTVPPSFTFKPPRHRVSSNNVWQSRSPWIRRFVDNRPSCWNQAHDWPHVRTCHYSSGNTKI